MWGSADQADHDGPGYGWGRPGGGGWALEEGPPGQPGCRHQDGRPSRGWDTRGVPHSELQVLGPAPSPGRRGPWRKGRSTQGGGWAQGRTTTRLPGGGQTPAQHRCTPTHAHRLLVTSWPGAAPGGWTHGICGGTGRTRRTGGCPRNQAILGVAKGQPDPPSKAAGVSPPPAAQPPSRGVGTLPPVEAQPQGSSASPSPPPGPWRGPQSITLMVPHPWGRPWELPVGDGDWKAPGPTRGTAEHWAALLHCRGLGGPPDSVPTPPQTCPRLRPAATSQTCSQLSEGREGPCPPGPPTPAVLDTEDRVMRFGAQATQGAVA